MSSINEVRIMGNLGADPELRTTQNGTSVTTVSVATTKKWRDDNGEHEQTEWHRVVVWGKGAESLCSMKKKGDQIYVAGYLQTRKYTDDSGVEKYSTEIVAGQWQWGGVVFTGKAPAGNRPGHVADDPNAAPPEGSGPGHARYGGGKAAASSTSRRTYGASSGGGDIDDDYIPSSPPGNNDIPF